MKSKKMQRSLSFAIIMFVMIFWIASCSLPRATPTQAVPAPLATSTLANAAICEGSITGLVVAMPDSNWSCTVELLGEGEFKNEIIRLTSPVFSIEMSTFGRGPFCQFAGQDESCVRTPFHSNVLLELSTWSSYGVIKEIFGSIQAQVNGQPGLINVSVKYAGMESRELMQQEKQQLVQLFDSITIKQ